jgi:hypothetical protein
VFQDGSFKTISSTSKVRSQLGSDKTRGDPSLTISQAVCQEQHRRIAYSKSMPCTAVLSLALGIMTAGSSLQGHKAHQKLDQILLSFSQAAKLMLTCSLETCREHNQAKAGAELKKNTNLYIQLAQSWKLP